MGPHGMLVGATGSGKSELLRSLTAALAARHDPVAGEPAAHRLQGRRRVRRTGRSCRTSPGLVTNLADDLSLVDRMQLALSGELARQARGAPAGGKPRLDRRLPGGPGPRRCRSNRCPTCVVVVDEFGELLVAKPEFLDTFLTVARLGRSLGVHLLLATQRLDEGRIRGLEPHLRYRICLRTFTAEESRAVLNTPTRSSCRRCPASATSRVDGDKARFKAATERPGAAVPGRRRLGAAATGAGAAAGQRAAAPAQPGRPVRHRRPGRAPPRLAPTTCRCWSRWQARRRRDGRARCGSEPLPPPTLGALLARARSGRRSVIGAPPGWATVPGSRSAWPTGPSGRRSSRCATGRPGQAATSGSPGAPRTGKSTLLQTLVLALAAARPEPTGASSTAWTWGAAGCSSWPACRTSGR